MKNFMIILTLLLIAATAIKANVFKCDDDTKESALKKVDSPNFGDKEQIPKDNNSGGSGFHDFFKKLSCRIQSGYDKIGAKTKEFTKKIGEKARDFGTDIKTKFTDFKKKLSENSDEDVTVSRQRLLRESVEIINPDILKAEQQCGHGHILDALGNCSKLRK